MKKQELGLIIRKETKFEILIRKVRLLFYLDNIKLIRNIDDLVKVNRPKQNKIIIPNRINNIRKLGNK